METKRQMVETIAITLNAVIIYNFLFILIFSQDNFLRANTFFYICYIICSIITLISLINQKMNKNHFSKTSFIFNIILFVIAIAKSQYFSFHTFVWLINLFTLEIKLKGNLYSFKNYIFREEDVYLSFQKEITEIKKEIENLNVRN